MDFTDNITERRVSFPKSDCDLVTGYLEPANPWSGVSLVNNTEELIELYKDSCIKHNTEPIESVISHLKTLNLSKTCRQIYLNLVNNYLTPEACEALEEIFKRVQYQTINLTACQLNDVAATAIFDMIEYYEATNELEISNNPDISSSGWHACTCMIRSSRALRSLTIRGTALSEITAANIGLSLSFSELHTLKLEHCGLQGRPISSLCHALRFNTKLKELWLSYNDLCYYDAEKLADLLKINKSIQLLDVSNNNIQNEGVKYLCEAIIEQSAAERQKAKQKVLVDAVVKLAQNINEDNNFDEISKLNNETNIHIENNFPIKSGIKCVSMLGSLLDTTSQNNDINNKENLSKSFDSKKDESTNITKIENESLTNEANYKLSNLSENDYQICNSININDPIKNSIENKNTKDINISASYIKNNNITNNQNELETNVTLLNIPTLKGIDFNENSDSHLYESDSFSTDSAFESASEGEIRMSNFHDVIKYDENSLNTNSTYDTKIIPIKGKENILQSRSISLDSLNADSSIDGANIINSCIKVNDKIQKNDTLNRQRRKSDQKEYLKPNGGLQALILWNNNITRDSSKYISKLLHETYSLELLNIGKNILSDDFIEKIKDNLIINTSLTNLGLQSTHLTCEGIKILAQIIQFGGNRHLQRIDIRDNNIQFDGLSVLNEALKSNESVSQIDIDDEPKRILSGCNDGVFYYTKALHAIRSLCSRHFSSSEKQSENLNTRMNYSDIKSRKISLTCYSTNNLSSYKTDGNLKNEKSLLDIRRTTRNCLRSPLPSPPTASPSSSPVPSPSKSRFQVFRVIENNTSISNQKTELNKQYQSLNVTSKELNILKPDEKEISKIKISEYDKQSCLIETVKTNLNNETEKSLDKVLETSSKENNLNSNFVPSRNLTTEAITLNNSLLDMLENNDKHNGNEINDSILNEQEFFPDSVIPEITQVDCKTNYSNNSCDDDFLDSKTANFNYPTTIDKFLNLFQNPSNLFSRSNSYDGTKTFDDKETTNLVIPRKLTPPCLFSRNKTAVNTNSIDNITTNQGIQTSFLDNAAKQLKDIADLGKQVFKQNFGSIDAICLDNQKSLKTHLKSEIKENISPEQTITANTICSFQSDSSQNLENYFNETINDPPCSTCDNKNTVKNLTSSLNEENYDSTDNIIKMHN